MPFFRQRKSVTQMRLIFIHVILKVHSLNSRGKMVSECKGIVYKVGDFVTSHDYYSVMSTFLAAFTLSSKAFPTLIKTIDGYSDNYLAKSQLDRLYTVA